VKNAKKHSRKRYGKYYVCSISSDYTSITIWGEGITRHFLLGQNLSQEMQEMEVDEI